LVAKAHSLQSLLALLDVEDLALTSTERETLVDWDSPGDIEHDAR
jgi:hypothetical protein